MTAPGDLNRRLVLEAPVENPDGSGGVTRLYDVVTTLWAQVVPLSSHADVVADAAGAVVRYRSWCAPALTSQYATGFRMARASIRSSLRAPAQTAASSRSTPRNARTDIISQSHEVSMTAPSSAALRAAVYDALIADGALSAALGGPKIYDEPPRVAAFPYVTLGEARIADFSAGSEPSEEHHLTLHVWSRQGGHREAHVITGALMQALDDAPLALANHHLVNFRFAVADVRREADGRTYHGLVRFRAVTEPV